MRKYQYSTKEFNFRWIVEKYLGTMRLENLHDLDKFEKKLTAGAGDYGDQKQKLHRKFYNKMDEDSSFKNLYDKFVKDFLASRVDFEFHYQRFPTFRIHQPENVGVFEFHKDKDYFHSEHEINIFLPMTKAYDSNTVWAESEEDKGDFSPMEAEYGELFLWDGANLNHGSQINETGQTRVSFDFRILPVKKYDESKAKNSITKGTSFTLGDYFQELG